MCTRPLKRAHVSSGLHSRHCSQVTLQCGGWGSQQSPFSSQGSSRGRTGNLFHHQRRWALGSFWTRQRRQGWDSPPGLLLSAHCVEEDAAKGGPHSHQRVLSPRTPHSQSVKSGGPRLHGAGLTGIWRAGRALSGVFRRQHPLDSSVPTAWGSRVWSSTSHLAPWFAVRVRAPGDRCDDAHCSWEPERPVSGPPSRYDEKAEINR